MRSAGELQSRAAVARLIAIGLSCPMAVHVLPSRRVMTIPCRSARRPRAANRLHRNGSGQSDGAVIRTCQVGVTDSEFTIVARNKIADLLERMTGPLAHHAWELQGVRGYQRSMVVAPHDGPERLRAGR